MKTSDMIQSPYLKRQDFPTPTVLTIKHLSLEKMPDGKDKWIAYFHEKTKGLTLNATKIRLIESTYGTETDNWIGKKVRLSDDPTVVFGSQVTGGIKLECSKGKAVKTTPVVAPAVEPDGDDAIPF